jgi:hypothetical protein
VRVTIGMETYHTINIAYRRWGRVVVCPIVIGRANVWWWIMHFTLYNYISHWLGLRDAILVDIGVLNHDAWVNDGDSVRNATRRTWPCNW